MKQIFKDITAQLDTVTELRWVDEEKGQMNFERPPIAFPAALVSIALPQTPGLTLTKQAASMQVVVKLCFDYSGETSNVTPTAARDKSLAYYDIVEKVYKALQGFTTGNFNPMERQNFSHLVRPDGYKTVQLIFGSAFIDDSTN